ncbi:phage head spike fiber domain-containing protein [Falsigemmobacter faecalis]|uniref:Uncharacterized protein n=1 Tax=Falsigemmobacter faecalis TaxID=2488730 RepID=A0A3P3D6P5_9RHOB|nr:hypothetical protein [Falsigemmobacter faecalis]RRH70045.1 hypothetical protein EG244_17705 [Falsigemmobacter faecalis]
MRLYQDATGGSPAYLAGHPVGFLLDANGPLFSSELVKDPQFQSGGADWLPGAAWTLTTGLASMALTSVYDPLSQMMTLEPGASYWVEIDVVSAVGTVLVAFRSSSAVRSNTAGLPASGRFSCLMTVQAGGADRFTIARSNAEASCVISRVSIRRVMGRIAAQATALSRPTLARHPKGGRRNLLPNTTFRDWSSAFVSRVDEGNNIFRMVENTTLNEHNFSTAAIAAPPEGTRITATVDLKMGTRKFAQVFMFRSMSPFLSVASVVVNLETGIITSTAAGNGEIIPLGDGWYRVTCWGETTFPEVVRLRVAMREVAATATYQGDGVSHIFMRLPQVEIGEGTPQQVVMDANDITEPGVPDVWHLYNDGGDSLPVTLPAGTYEIASVTPLGAVSYASVTSDGVTGTDLLRLERMADQHIRPGAYTPAEKAELERYWRQEYAA